MSETRGMHPFQAMIDAFNEVSQRARAGTQMTLGALIATLEALPPDRMIAGLGEPDSYRGYYNDLAFDPDAEARPVGVMLEAARACMGKMFIGYKGGEYVMGPATPLWVARYGEASDDQLVGLDTESDPIRPITAKEEW